jgi:hypothetical protein
MKGTSIFGAVALSLAVAGCAHPPAADIDAAHHALDEARQAEAAEYAPESWTAAQDAESKLQIELDAQEQRWSATRSYTTAQRLAQDAKAAGERSRDDAIAGKDKAKTDATTMMAQAREEVGRAHAALATAPRGKGTEADLASLKSDAVGIDESLVAMQQAFDGGNYNDAKSKAQAVTDAAKKIQNEVERAKSARRST